MDADGNALPEVDGGDVVLSGESGAGWEDACAFDFLTFGDFFLTAVDGGAQSMMTPPDEFGVMMLWSCSTTTIGTLGLTVDEETACVASPMGSRPAST